MGKREVGGLEESASASFQYHGSPSHCFCRSNFNP
jgi:hypothetical protein